MEISRVGLEKGSLKQKRRLLFGVWGVQEATLRTGRALSKRSSIVFRFLCRHKQLEIEQRKK